MRKTKAIFAGAVILAIFVSFYACHNQTGKTGSDSPADSSKTVQTALRDSLPYNVSIAKTDSVLDTQIRREFDKFSWQSFIALNWPTDSAQTIGQHGDNNTVWETWKENYQVFLPDGGKPEPWDTAKQGRQKLLVQVGKTPTVLTDVTQPFLTGPLIDQNGQYTRFQIVMNKEMFDYVDTNTLYNYQGQLNFKKAIDFPGGDNPTKAYGAIMVKASWKIMGKGDDPARFHTAKATIHVPAIAQRHIKDTTFQAVVGLVGFHIGTKSKTNPQWIWSTFEQVDNCPTFGEPDNGHYNFYDKSATGRKVNNKPDEPWDPNRPGQTPSQIVRYTPVFSGTKLLTDSIHKLFTAVNPKSVWQYYELVGTQWPVHASQLPAGDPFPVFMANATLESYIQGTVKDGKVVYTQGVTSSCIGCHNGATTLGGRTSDFTYLLRTAAAVKPPKK